MATCADLVAAVNSIEQKLDEVLNLGLKFTIPNGGGDVYLSQLVYELNKKFSTPVTPEGGGTPVDTSIAEFARHLSVLIQGKLVNRAYIKERDEKLVKALEYIADYLGERGAQLVAASTDENEMPGTNAGQIDYPDKDLDINVQL